MLGCRVLLSSEKDILSRVVCLICFLGCLNFLHCGVAEILYGLEEGLHLFYFVNICFYERQEKYFQNPAVVVEKNLFLIKLCQLGGCLNDCLRRWSWLLFLWYFGNYLIILSTGGIYVNINALKFGQRFEINYLSVMQQFSKNWIDNYLGI
jgi:hypothetical protein